MTEELDANVSSDAVEFAEWVALKQGLWFDDETLLWNIPDLNVDEWRQEYGFPAGIIRFKTKDLYQLFKSKDSLMSEVQQIFDLPKCYKTGGICRYECKGLCKDSC